MFLGRHCTTITRIAFGIRCFCTMNMALLKRFLLKLTFMSPVSILSWKCLPCSKCMGKTLDVGAASGRHAIFLQQKGIDITALDISPFCGRLMKAMGVENIAIEDVFEYQGSCYDTVYMVDEWCWSGRINTRPEKAT
jgi:2-polyprenyl-3-methyl-5-hydroxy-6-metoxy-1,4-benzoquinol methylase